MKAFDYSLDYKNLDLRAHPELYAVGRGEQGVLTVEPYKSEILPHWQFRTPKIALKSATTIYDMFEDYLSNSDFVGADMARKYLQMGFTRSRRYANYQGGKKYIGPVPQDKKGISGAHGREQYERAALDLEKAESAGIFKQYWDMARNHPMYKKQKKLFIEKYSHS